MCRFTQRLIPREEPPVEDYINFAVKLFRRNAPVPMVGRWYTVENASWFVYSMASFGILSAVVGECHMRFWPGDRPDSSLVDGDAYKAECSRRSKKVKEFTQSDDLLYSTIVFVYVQGVVRFTIFIHS